MSFLEGCLDDELPNVPIDNCPEHFGQIQKIVLAHLRQADGTKTKFAPNAAVDPTDPAVIATWTPLLAAADRTKVVQTPFISEPVSEAGAMRTYGGGNATRNGIILNVGREAQQFESKILATKQESIRALKEMQKGGGTGQATLGGYLINDSGQIAMSSNGLASDDVGFELFPFDLNALFIGDKTLGGLESIDFNMFNFMFSPNWSDNFSIVTPTDFNALEDLVTP